MMIWNVLNRHWVWLRVHPQLRVNGSFLQVYRIQRLQASKDEEELIFRVFRNQNESGFLQARGLLWVRAHNLKCRLFISSHAIHLAQCLHLVRMQFIRMKEASSEDKRHYYFPNVLAPLSRALLLRMEPMRSSLQLTHQPSHDLTCLNQDCGSPSSLQSLTKIKSDSMKNRCRRLDLRSQKQGYRAKWPSGRKQQAMLDFKKNKASLI